MHDDIEVLIVDDNVTAARSLAMLLTRPGTTAVAIGSGAEAIQLLGAQRFDVAVVDLRMAPVDGMAVLRAARSLPRPPAVIMVTAFGSVPLAVQAVRLGAFDFLTKPFSSDAVRSRIAQAVRERSPDPAPEDTPGPDELAGVSAAMERVRTDVHRLAAAASAVLVQGEPGTGKSHLARALHTHGPRRDAPFVVLEGMTVDEHGSPRAFSEAAHGTLVIEGVHGLSPDAQAALVAICDARSVARPGGAELVTARLVTTSSASLDDAVASGRFRADLLYRINAVTVTLPPLRQRLEDIPSLVAALRARGGGPALPPDDDDVRAAVLYRWPGNVRQLANQVERLRLGLADTLTPSEIDLDAPVPTLGEHLDAEEERILRQAWTRCAGNQSEMARLLGVERTALRYRLRKFGLVK